MNTEGIIKSAMLNFISQHYGEYEDDACYNIELMAQEVYVALLDEEKLVEPKKEKVVLGKIAAGKCPYCGSEDLDYNAIKHVDDSMEYYPVVCNNCKRKFEEWYRLEFSGHNVGEELNIDAVEGLEIVMEPTGYKPKLEPGARIVCIHMGEDPRPIPDGMRGTVDHIDSTGTIFVRWDNGSGLGIVPGVDEYKLI